MRAWLRQADPNHLNSNLNVETGRKHEAQEQGHARRLGAVLLWASVVALVRGVSESLGATGGAAMIYTVASALLLLTIGFPDLSKFPKNICSGAGCCSSRTSCLALSIGYASNGQQAIEVAMVNYQAELHAGRGDRVQQAARQPAGRARRPAVDARDLPGARRRPGPRPGLHNVADNPLSYGLAFVGALIWAGYCTVTARLADGKNGVTPFFMLVALALWIKFAIEGGGGMTFSLHAVIYIVLAASALGFGYAAWNTGIMYGNVTVIVGASYFTPVLAALLAATLLHAPLSIEFWQGALMVCGGSILCWLATRSRRRESLAPPGRQRSAGQLPGLTMAGACVAMPLERRSCIPPIIRAARLQCDTHGQPGQHRAHQPALGRRPDRPPRQKARDAAGHAGNQRIHADTHGDLHAAERQRLREHAAVPGEMNCGRSDRYITAIFGFARFVTKPIVNSLARLSCGSCLTWNAERPPGLNARQARYAR